MLRLSLNAMRLLGSFLCSVIGLISDRCCRFSIRDRDSIFSAEVDEPLQAFGLQGLHTPAGAPQANAYCEPPARTVRRKCLDFMIPFGEAHLERILKEWVRHYNQGLSLGPGISGSVMWEAHRGPRGQRFSSTKHRVRSRRILGRLHHEYAWERMAA
jgi:hypothetical protein